MIKCPHLTPKSIYSNIGDFVADLYLDEVHMFWSLSIFSYVLSLSFSFQKKLHLGIFFHFYSSVFVNISLALINSLKIFYKFLENLLKYSSQSDLNSFSTFKGERPQIQTRFLKF